MTIRKEGKEGEGREEKGEGRKKGSHHTLAVCK